MDTTQELHNLDITALTRQRLETLRRTRLNGSGETTAEPVYKCPKCRDTGWEEVEGENGYARMFVWLVATSKNGSEIKVCGYSEGISESDSRKFYDGLLFYAAK